MDDGVLGEKSPPYVSGSCIGAGGGGQLGHFHLQNGRGRERRGTRGEMSANEDEGQIAILHKIARGWRRSGSNGRAGKSAGGEPEVVGAAEGDEVTPPVHKHVTRLLRVHACTGRERKGALQLVKRLYLLECFLPYSPSTVHLPPRSRCHGAVSALASPDFLFVSPPPLPWLKLYKPSSSAEHRPFWATSLKTSIQRSILSVD